MRFVFHNYVSWLIYGIRSIFHSVSIYGNSQTLPVPCAICTTKARLFSRGVCQSLSITASVGKLGNTIRIITRKAFSFARIQEHVIIIRD